MDISRLLHCIRSGCPDPYVAALYHGGGGKSKAPDPPDYTGAAQAQAQSSKEAVTAQTWANRPTLNTPWGSQTWDAAAGTDPSTGQAITNWTSNVTLSPEQAAAQQSQAEITQGRSEAAKTLLGQATGAFQQPFDWEGKPAVPGSVEDAQKGAYATMSAMQEPRRAREQEALRTRLANQGLGMESQAFKNAQMDQGDVFAQQDKGMMAQALAEGRSDVTTQQQMRQAAIAEEAQRRGMPLNELNALLTAQQVSMPSMPSFQNSGAAQPTNFLGAAGMQNDAAMGQYQANLAAQPNIGALAGSAAMAAGSAGFF